MGSSNSKEKELNEDLERIRKERIARERAERERAERDRAERDRAERDRVANLKLILVKVTSPPPGCEIEIDEAVTVRVFLEEVAPHYGLKKSDAPLLQLEFSETVLKPEQHLTAAGMCDKSLCSVLGVQAILETRKAKAAAKAAAAALEKRKANTRKAKAVDIVTAAYHGRMADVQLVCQYAPEKVNDKNYNRNGETALHFAASSNSLEIARLLLATNAAADVRNDNGETALHYAALKISLEMARLLLASKAAVNIRNDRGFTPMKYAQDNGNQQMVALLQQDQQ